MKNSSETLLKENLLNDVTLDPVEACWIFPLNPNNPSKHTSIKLNLTLNKGTVSCDFSHPVLLFNLKSTNPPSPLPYQRQGPIRLTSTLYPPPVLHPSANPFLQKKGAGIKRY
jgi:hypothetical protein